MADVRLADALVDISVFDMDIHYFRNHNHGWQTVEMGPFVHKRVPPPWDVIHASMGANAVFGPGAHYVNRSLTAS